MKTCRFCLKEDLADDARRCPYCGTWQSKAARFFSVSLWAVAWIFAAVLVISLAGCGMAFLIK
jgi:hypothetical protein